ncbi:TPA: hypothetical protein QEK92_002110 [Stenotrophomonas maltophilia]|nr:hypothetical protein [Stenotrophomonas maltophilia]HDS1541510.1 hypothetical protein [Stenotrophomonas maltophilia]
MGLDLHSVMAVLPAASASSSSVSWLAQAIPEVGKVVVAVITVGGALGGVLLGSRLTGGRERRAKEAKQQEDLLFLAVTVSAVLEAFVSECASVSTDDGTSMGQLSRTEDGEEYRSQQVDTPKLDFSDLKVAWTALPAEMLDRLHALPAKLRNVESALSDVREHDWSPYDEYFEHRQLKYAKLGVNAGQLSREIRTAAGLRPELDEEQTVFEWLSEREMRLRLESEQHDQRRMAANAKMIATLTK